MLKRLLQINREYRDAKEKAVEQGINAFESKVNPLFAVLFLTLLIIVWSTVALTPDGLRSACGKQGSFSVAGFFIISYFAFFLGSKFIFKPTEEELTDDTSVFALFSACRRREFRSLISIGLSLFHTLIFILYLLNEDIRCF